MGPDELRGGDGDAVENPLGDEADLNVAMVGVDLSADCGAIGFRLAMEMLIAGAGVDPGHGGHPEVVGVNAESADGLFERQLNFETQAIEANDLQGIQGQVRA